MCIHSRVGQNGANPFTKVVHQTKLIPRNAISCLSEGTIAVRKQDFLSKSSEQILVNRLPLNDLHDFAHLTTATLSPELYGNSGVCPGKLLLFLFFPFPLPLPFSPPLSFHTPQR